jgi:hypothetical protein
MGFKGPLPTIVFVTKKEWPVPKILKFSEPKKEKL